MWSTVNGPRVLIDAEAALVRGAIGVMLDHLVDEGRNQTDAVVYGIDWFDQWDWQQRIWLLDQITVALLTEKSPPTPAAMLEATVDAAFFEVIGLIELEIEANTIDPIEPECGWRESVLDAFESQYGRSAPIDRANADRNAWRRVVTSVADPILGVRLYQKVEAFRDWDIKRLDAFLRSRGLTSDFLEQIPPLRNLEQTQRSIDDIQAFVV